MKSRRLDSGTNQVNEQVEVVSLIGDIALDKKRAQGPCPRRRRQEERRGHGRPLIDLGEGS